MAIEDDDPIRRAHRRATARSQALAHRMFGTPAPGSGDPVLRADGTVYDGTGEKPTARDVLAQLDSTTARTDTREETDGARL